MTLKLNLTDLHQNLAILWPGNPSAGKSKSDASTQNDLLASFQQAITPSSPPKQSDQKGFGAVDSNPGIPTRLTTDWFSKSGDNQSTQVLPRPFSKPAYNIFKDEDYVISPDHAPSCLQNAQSETIEKPASQTPEGSALPIELPPSPALEASKTTGPRVMDNSVFAQFIAHQAEGHIREGHLPALTMPSFNQYANAIPRSTALLEAFASGVTSVSTSGQSFSGGGFSTFSQGQQQQQQSSSENPFKRAKWNQ